MREGITLLKWDHLNWWPGEWLNCSKNTIKTRKKKAKINTEVFKVNKKIENQIVFTF